MAISLDKNAYVIYTLTFSSFSCWSLGFLLLLSVFCWKCFSSELTFKDWIICNFHLYKLTRIMFSHCKEDHVTEFHMKCDGNPGVCFPHLTFYNAMSFENVGVSL